LENGVRVIRTMRWGYNRNTDLTALECIPTNRFLNERDFHHILRGRNMQMAYRAKQMTKRLVPSRIYEPIRTFVFGLLGRN
jgi:hypothetical protein